MVRGSFLIAAAALKTPTRNGYNAQSVNLTSNDRNPNPTSQVAAFQSDFERIL